MAKKKSSKARVAQKKRQKRSAKKNTRDKAKAAAKARVRLRVVDEHGDVPLDSLPLLPDRRALEGTLARLAAGGSSDDPLVQAQELMYEAWDASSGREATGLAREAIRISPGCADAYNLLAERSAKNMEEAAELYRLGVSAGERTLGPQVFEEDVGHFWGLMETRPYMRAKEGLAQSLWHLGQRDEAVEHYRSMLQLNPNDNQGIRHGLAAWLLALGEENELVALLKQYEDDPFAGWTYTKALIAFRQEGDNAGSRKLLLAATEKNPHVPAYLLGNRKLPRRLPDYMGFGDETEAIAFFADFAESWNKTPGALKWLRETWQ